MSGSAAAGKVSAVKDKQYQQTQTPGPDLNVLTRYLPQKEDLFEEQSSLSEPQESVHNIYNVDSEDDSDKDSQLCIDAEEKRVRGAKKMAELDYEDLKKKLGFGQNQPNASSNMSLLAQKTDDHDHKDRYGLNFEGRAFIQAPVRQKIHKRLCELPPEDKTPGQFEWPPKRCEFKSFKVQMRESRKLD